MFCGLWSYLNHFKSDFDDIISKVGPLKWYNLTSLINLIQQILNKVKQSSSSSSSLAQLSPSLFALYYGDIRGISRWYLGNIWVISMWYLSDILSTFGWYIGDSWVKFGQYSDDILVILRCYLGNIKVPFGLYFSHPNIVQISPKYHCNIPQI